MTEVAKLASELHIGDILAADSLPIRTVRAVIPVNEGEMVTVTSHRLVPSDADYTEGVFTESLNRNHLVALYEQ